MKLTSSGTLAVLVATMLTRSCRLEESVEA